MKPKKIEMDQLLHPALRIRRLSGICNQGARKYQSNNYTLRLSNKNDNEMLVVVDESLWESLVVKKRRAGIRILTVWMTHRLVQVQGKVGSHKSRL